MPYPILEHQHLERQHPVTIKYTRAYYVLRASQTAEQKIYTAIRKHDQTKFSSALNKIMSNPFMCEINNMVTPRWETIAHCLASSNENLLLLRKFLDADSERSIWDLDYKSVDLTAEDIWGKTALICAIENNAVDIVKELITKDASLINQQLLCPVIYFAISHNNPAIVKLLLENGANLELCSIVHKQKISEYSAALTSGDENTMAIQSMIAEAVDRECLVRNLAAFDEPVEMECGAISLVEHYQVQLLSYQHITEI